MDSALFWVPQSTSLVHCASTRSSRQQRSQPRSPRRACGAIRGGCARQGDALDLSDDLCTPAPRAHNDSLVHSTIVATQLAAHDLSHLRRFVRRVRSGLGRWCSLALPFIHMCTALVHLISTSCNSHARKRREHVRDLHFALGAGLRGSCVVTSCTSSRLDVLKQSLPESACCAWAVIFLQMMPNNVPTCAYHNKQDYGIPLSCR